MSSRHDEPEPKKAMLTSPPHRRVTTTTRAVEGDVSGLLVEDSGGSEPLPRPSGKRFQRCWVPGCAENYSYAKIHTFRFQVPGIFSENLSPTSETTQSERKRSLLQAATWLLRRPGTLQDLQHSSGCSVSWNLTSIYQMTVCCDGDILRLLGGAGSRKVSLGVGKLGSRPHSLESCPADGL